MNLLPKQLDRFSPNTEGMFERVSLKTRTVLCVQNLLERGPGVGVHLED